MLFSCSLLATGFCNLTDIPRETQWGAFTSYRYAQWRISNCSPTQTQTVITLLDQLNQHSSSIVQAIQSGTETALYRTFFKDDRELPFVQAVFTNLAAGKEVQADSESHKLHHAAPDFICTLPSGHTATYHEQCNEEQLDAVTFNGLENVVLCPAFWNELYPTSSNATFVPNCPSVGRDSTLPRSEDMLESKLAILIHELVHLYMPNQIIPEVYTMRASAELSAIKAAHNADNYTFFAMSKSQRL